MSVLWHDTEAKKKILTLIASWQSHWSHSLMQAVKILLLCNFSFFPHIPCPSSVTNVFCFSRLSADSWSSVNIAHWLNDHWLRQTDLRTDFWLLFFFFSLKVNVSGVNTHVDSRCFAFELCLIQVHTKHTLTKKYTHAYKPINSIWTNSRKRRLEHHFIFLHQLCLLIFVVFTLIFC